MFTYPYSYAPYSYPYAWNGWNYPYSYNPYSYGWNAFSHPWNYPYSYTNPIVPSVITPRATIATPVAGSLIY